MNNHMQLTVYTRQEDELYTTGYANSLHFGLSDQEGAFHALNQNYGVLFVPGKIRDNNTIQELGAAFPTVFEYGHGYGIAALAVDQQGEFLAADSKNLVLWQTSDFQTFEIVGEYVLPIADLVALQSHYEGETKSLVVNWQKENGETYQCAINQAGGVSAKTAAPGLRLTTGNIPLPHGQASGSLTLPNALAAELLVRWNPLQHTSIELPATVATEAERHELKATAIYNDGSKASKEIEWDPTFEEQADGSRTYTGQIKQDVFPFPVAEGYADPQIIYWDDHYYFIATNDNVGNIGIFVRKATTMAGLFVDGYTEYKILDLDVDRQFVQNFWAPEFHVINDRLTILFAVSPDTFSPQCHLMPLKAGGKIEEAAGWDVPVRITKADGSFLADANNNQITLDMTVLRVNDQGYYVWSYRENIGTALDSGSMVLIASFAEDNPTSLTSEPVILTRPIYGWENTQGTINNEGPYALCVNDTVRVYYSGGAATWYTYAIGCLTLKEGADPLVTESWFKEPTPVLSYYSVAGEYGPGHHSFFTDLNGDIYIAYHGEIQPKGTPRCSALRKVHFAADGRPVLDLSETREVKPELRQVAVTVKKSDN